MKKIKERGITLVALVVTIIILLILAGISLWMVTSGNGILGRAKNAANLYRDSAAAENNTLNNYASAIKKAYDDSSKVSKSTPFVGYYADTDKDGNIDGIIYADLAIGNTGSGSWQNEPYSIPVENKNDLKDYYISKSSYKFNDAFGEKPVLSPLNSGKNRFYIMTLTDFSTVINNYKMDRFTWYLSANSFMKDFSSTTSDSFGAGKSNTQNIIKKFTNSAYGNQSNGDILKYLSSLSANGWFLPSLKEWIAFEGELVKTTSYSSCSSFGLQWGYWTSTQATESCVWDIYPGDGKHQASVTNSDYVRFSKTF